VSTLRRSGADQTIRIDLSTRSLASKTMDVREFTEAFGTVQFCPNSAEEILNCKLV
jgi:hypothetical protein